jgi:hypothetical protein
VISNLIEDGPLGDDAEIAEADAAVREHHMRLAEEDDRRANNQIF